MVFMSLLWLTVLALCSGTLIPVSAAESVNKDKSASSASSSSLATGTAAADAPLVKGVAAVVMDHSDLPTRFGDEDDVIEGKAAAAAEKKASDNAGNGSNGKTDVKSGDHRFDHDSDEEHYDDDEDYLISEHVQGKDEHDMDESDSEYEDETDLGPTLDNFGAKLDGSDTGEELPIFLVEPQSAYVIRNRAAVLKCKAAHALQVNTDERIVIISYYITYKCILSDWERMFRRDNAVFLLYVYINDRMLWFIPSPRGRIKRVFSTIW